METSGAILLGSSVGETIRKGIVDPTFYYNDQMCNNFTGYNNENYTQYLCPDRLNNATLLLYGQLSAMLGKKLGNRIIQITLKPFMENAIVNFRGRVVANNSHIV